jgi:hypothetical protein
MSDSKPPHKPAFAPLQPAEPDWDRMDPMANGNGTEEQRVERLAEKVVERVKTNPGARIPRAAKPIRWEMVGVVAGIVVSLVAAVAAVSVSMDRTEANRKAIEAQTTAQTAVNDRHDAVLKQTAVVVAQLAGALETEKAERKGSDDLQRLQIADVAKDVETLVQHEGYTPSRVRRTKSEPPAPTK